MIYGRFIKELSNRFVGLVEVAGKIEKCYISSSSKYQNYINLSDKIVLLECAKDDKRKTKYTLIAVIQNGVYYYLDLNGVNKLFLKYFSGYRKDLIFAKEKKIMNYSANSHQNPIQSKSYEINSLDFATFL